jgi:hypothetical protein
MGVIKLVMVAVRHPAAVYVVFEEPRLPVPAVVLALEYGERQGYL